MAMSTASLLARLEELKKWQAKQQERLLLQQQSRNESTLLSTPNNASLSITDTPEKSATNRLSHTNEYQNREILMTRDTNTTSNQIYKPMEPNIQVSNPNKAKKPFLKRGAGLARYKLHANDQPKPINRVKVKKRSNGSKENVHKVRFEDDVTEKKVLTPLKVPEFQAVWCDARNENRRDEDVIAKETISQINANFTEPMNDYHMVKCTNMLETSEEQNRLERKDVATAQEQTNRKFSELTLKDQVGFLANLRETNGGGGIQETIEFEDEIETDEFRIRKKQCFGRNAQKLENDLVVIQDMQFNSYECFRNFNEKQYDDKSENVQMGKAEVSDQSLYERNLERDLLIFETLEEKAMNSSFSSTNSSVVKILSSTPNKILEIREKNRQKLAGKHRKMTEIITERILEEDIQSFDVNSDTSSVTSDDFYEKTIENDFQSATDTCTDGVHSLDTSSSSETCSESQETCSESQYNNIGTQVSGSEIFGTKTPIVDNTDSKDDVLTRKLKELDEEIQNFRVENAKLHGKKLEFEKNEKMFKKEKKEFEKYVLEEKIKVEFYLEDEKKKFAKEKMIFDKYVKETQNKTNRKEREEISTLKEEIANLKEAAKLKETRNATSQARLRNQLKAQEKEINNLKEDLEKLRKQNAKLTTSQKFNKKTSDTKVLQEINKNLSKLTKDVKIQDQLKKLDELASKDKEVSPIVVNKRKSLDRKSTEREVCDNSIVEVKSSESYRSYDQFLGEKPQGKVVIESPRSLEKKSEFVDEALVKAYEEIFGAKEAEVKSRGESQRNTSKSDSTLNDSKMSKTETIQPDGSKEIKYSNGNLKIISPDGNLVRMKYFNGDIKETNLLEGAVKYFYAENQSWHTTEPDGTEILQFPDGQVETKYPDGTHEVQLPNGTVKLTRADTSESISYADGTKVDISGTGEKIIVLPNGQKEIHTSEHMRREYPDGTVKIVYPDGIQETRYCNGRIRIKDKSGKLLLDSHEENT